MKNRNRRGVLLLIVLALLAMFALVGVAFVVLTGAERRVSERLRTIDAVKDSPDKTLEQAFGVVMSGVPCDPSGPVPTSAIKWCSLLEKKYGFDTVQGTLAKAPTLICGGQLLEFDLPAGPDPFHCVGCVVTMLKGAAAGLSTHIVGINPQTFAAQMAAFEGGVVPTAGDTFLINGFPYSGMGFGFDPKTGKLGALALQPNAPPADWIAGAAKGSIAGGVNGDCTVPNYQDPLPAFVVPNPNVNGGIIVAIPSMHRSDLIRFAAPANANELRLVMFRPIGANCGVKNPDHPNFTGSNPNFNPTWDGITKDGSQWDVDNDGDGIPDSVWVDLGLPVRYTTDGRAYKPLFAILCPDMNGRLNINAHGSIAQANAAYYQAQNVQSAASYQKVSNLDVGPYSATGGQLQFAGPAGSSVTTAPVNLMRGQGSGPAEVNLLPLFRDPSTPTNFLWGSYQNLLWGSGANMGRYGPGIGTALPGINGQGSALTINNEFPYGGVMGVNYWTNPNLDAYGSPPDPQAMGSIALDPAGRPFHISMGGQVANGPYDIDLTRNAPHAVNQAYTDNPFGVAEFERILRPFDRDSNTLPQRLFDLTNTGNGSLLQSRRAEITIESPGMPISSGVLPMGLRDPLPGNTSTHPVDILYAQILKNSPKSDPKKFVAQLLPWEVMNGLKMDLNRPFGSGAFSKAGNGSMIAGFATTTPPIPDQPGLTGETITQYVSGGGVTASAKCNYAADAGAFSGATNSFAARQLYARHLYVLMMAVADTAGMLADLKKTNASATSEDVARLLAQWAVNAVAYRDHNGIMIPFPYDPFPFGSGAKAAGWAPDNTPLHTVWGCKRPELLISETLAFHDRRTQDLNTEIFDKNKPGNGARTEKGKTKTPGGETDPKKIDPGFNSNYRPEGSVFIELFNPWPTKEPRTPDLAPTNGAPGVELTKVTPAVGALKASPVWRLIIVDPSKSAPTNGDELADPDSPTLASRPTIERVAYFVPLAGMNYPTTDGQVSYNPSTKNKRTVVVAPGGYAVVGSGDANVNNITYLGFPTSGQPPAGPPPATARWVTLNQADVTAGDPRVLRCSADPKPPANPPQVLGIDQALPAGNGANATQRMSVSEPTKGYVPYEKAADGTQMALDPVTGKYTNGTLDIPVDQQRDLIGKESVWTTLNTDGTVAGYRIIYLQRLADPTRPFVAESTVATTANPADCNPYRTIDAMTVDLTCFNGVTTSSDPTLTKGTFHFESHQRGEKNYLPGTATEMNIWKQEPANKSTLTPAGWTGGGTAPSANNFMQPLNQTFGFLNKIFGTASNSPLGDPQYPFPWLNWSYRPFVNAYELLQVPAVSSSRLLARSKVAANRSYFGYLDGTMRAGQPPVYDGSSGAQVPYPHLLNFFESGKSSAVGTSAQLHRIFAYVGVQSKFANAQIQMRADQAAAAAQANYYHPPFNRIPRYRDPGMINPNTIGSPDVLFGAMNAYLPPLQQSSQINPVFWDKYVRSRRGEAGIKSTPSPTTDSTMKNMLTVTGNGPSRFMHPYRTPGGASLMAGAEPAREADVTLLREDPDVANRPLFEMDDYLMGTGGSGVGTTPDKFSLACMDYNRNPYFRYQAIQKLGNVFCPHSNVFAVWITVGYFEVSQHAVDAGHPDGFELGQELGSDTGDIVRHRAFYMIDRSIPVGFIRGQDINSSHAVLVNRFIE